MKPFDHFIYGGRDLATMRKQFAALTGLEATPGGRHPGLGTHNALASLGDDIYFELMAVDDTQKLADNLGARLQTFAKPHLFAYMVRTADLETPRDLLASHAITCDLFAASRTTPDGRELKWRLLMPHKNPFDGLIPNFIDWQGTTPHPAQTSAAGCRFVSFTLAHPRGAGLAAVLAELDVDIPVHAANHPGMTLTMDTPRGRRVLTDRD